MKVKQNLQVSLESINHLRIFSSENIKRKIINKKFPSAPPRDLYSRIVGILEKQTSNDPAILLSFAALNGLLSVKIKGEVKAISRKKKEILNILKQLREKYEIYNEVFSRLEMV